MYRTAFCGSIEDCRRKIDVRWGGTTFSKKKRSSEDDLYPRTADFWTPNTKRTIRERVPSGMSRNIKPRR